MQFLPSLKRKAPPTPLTLPFSPTPSSLSLAWSDTSSFQSSSNPSSTAAAAAVVAAKQSIGSRPVQVSASTADIVAARERLLKLVSTQQGLRLKDGRAYEVVQTIVRTLKKRDPKSAMRALALLEQLSLADDHAVQFQLVRRHTLDLLTAAFPSRAPRSPTAVVHRVCELLGSWHAAYAPDDPDAGDLPEVVADLKKRGFNIPQAPARIKLQHLYTPSELRDRRDRKLHVELQDLIRVNTPDSLRKAKDIMELLQNADYTPYKVLAKDQLRLVVGMMDQVERELDQLASFASSVHPSSSSLTPASAAVLAVLNRHHLVVKRWLADERQAGRKSKTLRALESINRRLTSISAKAAALSEASVSPGKADFIREMSLKLNEPALIQL